jgi:hypothetical protein
MKMAAVETGGVRKGRRKPTARSQPTLLVPLVLAATTVLAGVTVGGLLRLWPYGPGPRVSGIRAVQTEGAEVESVAANRCSDVGLETCFRVGVKLLDGPDKGSTATVWVGKTTGYTSFSVGDRVRVLRNPPPPLATAGQAWDATPSPTMTGACRWPGSPWRS